MKYRDDDRRCLACGVRGVDLHHIRARGMGGNHNTVLDAPWNLLPLCRKHHSEIHSQGTRIFVEKWNQVRAFMKLQGWDFDPIFFKWRHPNEKEIHKT